MKALPLLSWLALASVAAAVPPTPPPAPGKYSGLITIRRTVPATGLTTTVTAKAEASLAADGKLTILTAVRESPGAAAYIENSVVRAVPRPVPPLPSAPGNLTVEIVPVTVLEPIYPPGTNYIVNGNIPAKLQSSSRMLSLNYQLPIPPIADPLEFTYARPPVLPSPITITPTPANPSTQTGTTWGPETLPPDPGYALPSQPFVKYEFTLRWNAAANTSVRRAPAR